MESPQHLFNLNEHSHWWILFDIHEDLLTFHLRNALVSSNF